MSRIDELAAKHTEAFVQNNISMFESIKAALREFAAGEPVLWIRSDSLHKITSKQCGSQSMFARVSDHKLQPDYIPLSLYASPRAEPTNATAEHFDLSYHPQKKTEAVIAFSQNDGSGDIPSGKDCSVQNALLGSEPTAATLIAEMEAEIEHIKDNAVNVSKLPGFAEEGRCRELAAGYLEEFVRNIKYRDDPINLTSAEPDYEALEREHFGDSDKKTGIYAEPFIGVDEGKSGGDMSATVTGKFKDGVMHV